MSDYAAQIASGMIEYNSGNFAVCLDKASPDLNGYMAKVDGKWVKVRAALPEEIVASTKRLEALQRKAAPAATPAAK